MRVRSTIRTALAGVAVAAVAVGGFPALALAADPEPDHPDEPFAAHVPETPPTVTLITGDRVTLMEGSDGEPLVSFEPAPRDDGRPVSHSTFGRGDHVFVVPSDVAALVPEKLDLNLFDITALQQLAADGADGLPVIVGTGSAENARTDAPEWDALGVEADTVLESISAVAGEVAAEGAPELVEAAEESAAVEKVWLDAPVIVEDADSMPQIGAPAAWSGGLDGSGVTVAVLDSGIDTSHPDLDQGVVALEHDFTGSGTPVDQLGHGTHVASIIAGSGEASGGVNRGVAPGAHLMNARVLNAQGQGETSWVIDAMEWAASNGADIINMSLGVRGEYTDGTDPGAMAVNSIAERYGTLVVIAAGNEGSYMPGTVTTPGTADRALTVGAVDDHDVLAPFSSVGPRFGDGAIKPDVVAPGTDIIAARAANTNPMFPVDEYYTSESGTSMAAPHVAGAAAILKSARPSLSGDALKKVLMSSAQSAGNPVFWEGAGRIWIPGALAQSVYASSGSLSFGVFPSPRDTQAPRTQTVTYTNTSGTDTTLELELSAEKSDGSPAPDGMATVAAPTVTVPAFGSATVEVTVDPQAGDPGVYTGVLTAVGEGTPPVRTVLGYTVEQNMSVLRIDAFQHGGERAGLGSQGMIHGVDDPEFNQWFSFTDGVAEVRVPRGRYTVMGQLLDSAGPTALFIEGFTSFSYDVDLNTDQEIVLEADKALPVEISTEKKSRPWSLDSTVLRELPDRPYPVSTSISVGISIVDGGLDLDLAVLTHHDPDYGAQTIHTRYIMNQPLLDATVSAKGEKIDIARELSYGILSPKHIGKLSAPLVHAGTGTPAELEAAGVRGVVALVEDRREIDLNQHAQDAHDAGAVAVIVYGATPGAFFESVDFRHLNTMSDKVLPTLTLPRDVGLELVELAETGKAKITGDGRKDPGYQYALGYIEDGDPETLSYRAEAENTAQVELDVRGFLEGARTIEYATMIGGGIYTGFPYLFTGPLPDRTVYYSTDPDITFHRTVKPAEYLGVYPAEFAGAPRTYKPGQRTTETMLAQVHHGGFWPSPATPQEASVFRDGDVLVVDLPYRVDDDGHAQSWGPDQDTTSRFRFWAGDTLLVDSEYANGSGLVPADETVYRMLLETSRDVEWWNQSTAVSSEWTFPSSTTDGATVLPLLQVDYGVEGLDPLNTDDRKSDLKLTVSHQDGSTGSAIEGLELWSSFDDGTTWTPVRVKPGKGEGAFSATISSPKDVSSVSLRVKTWDSAGATFTETVIDAIAVKDRGPGGPGPGGPGHGGPGHGGPPHAG